MQNAMQIASKTRGFLTGVLYMSRNKKNGRLSTKSAARKGFYMFSRDLLSSQRYRRCSWVAKGVYCDLLNVLALQPKPGSICLRDFDLRPKNERSLTFRCLQCQKKAKAGEYQSIVYFAEAIAVSGASGPRPGLIHGLQELYLRGMILIEGDTMIQPRMYLDNGFELTDKDGNPRVMADDGVTVVGSPDDAAGDTDAEIVRLQKEVEKGAEKSTEKDDKKPRVGAGDAPVRSKRVGGRVNNNIDSKEDIGGMGENRDGENENEKPEDNTPKPTETAQISTKGGKAGDLSTQQEKRAQKPRKGQNRATVADNPPTLEDVQAYFDERTQQGKPFLYITPDGFYDACCQSGWTLKDGKPMMDWRARCRTFESFRKEHGDRPIGQKQQRQRTDDSPKHVDGDNFEGMDTW
jgi:hypothetical protein